MLKYNKRYLFAIAVSTTLLGACGSLTQPAAPVVQPTPTTANGTQSDKQKDAYSGSISNTNIQQERLSEQEIQALASKCNDMVHFEFDSFALDQENQRIVDCHAGLMLEHKTLDLHLVGHTDARGSAGYNVALGAKRANAVQRVLEVKGVSAMRIEATSMGEEFPFDVALLQQYIYPNLQEEYPLVEGSDEAAYAQNRRVEFTYSNAKQHDVEDQSTSPQAIGNTAVANKPE